MIMWNDNCFSCVIFLLFFFLLSTSEWHFKHDALAIRFIFTIHIVIITAIILMLCTLREFDKLLPLSRFFPSIYGIYQLQQQFVHIVHRTQLFCIYPNGICYFRFCYLLLNFEFSSFFIIFWHIAGWLPLYKPINIISRLRLHFRCKNI